MSSQVVLAHQSLGQLSAPPRAARGPRDRRRRLLRLACRPLTAARLLWRLVDTRGPRARAVYFFLDEEGRFGPIGPVVSPPTAGGARARALWAALRPATWVRQLVQARRSVRQRLRELASPYTREGRRVHPGHVWRARRVARTVRFARWHRTTRVPGHARYLAHTDPSRLAAYYAALTRGGALDARVRSALAPLLAHPDRAVRLATLSALGGGGSRPA